MVFPAMRGAVVKTLPGERVRPPRAYVPPLPSKHGQVPEYSVY